LLQINGIFHTDNKFKSYMDYELHINM
jgi:hypothetical protein